MEPTEHKPPFLSQLRPNDIHPITASWSNHFRRMQREFIYTSHFDPSAMPLVVTRVNCFPGSEFRIAKCFSMLVFKEGSEGSYNMFRTPMVGSVVKGGGWRGWIPRACEAIYVTYRGKCMARNSSTHPSRFLCFARAFISFFSHQHGIAGAVFCSAELDKHFCKLNKARWRWTCVKSVTKYEVDSVLTAT